MWCACIYLLADWFTEWLLKEELESDWTGLVSSGCLEVLRRRGDRCGGVGSVSEDMHVGEN